MSDETKHTPGPWEPRGDEWGDLVVSAGTKEIALIRHYPGKEPDANARLIAAAPELAQLAMDVLTELEAPSCRAQNPEHCVACRLVAAARAALEKAGLR